MWINYRFITLVSSTTIIRPENLFTISHVGTLYSSEISIAEVEVLDTNQQSLWEDMEKYHRPVRPPSLRRLPQRLREKRIIVFPLHFDVPQHWTLGITFNCSWNNAPGAAAEDQRWKLFHFDSLGDNRAILTKAHNFAAFLLETAPTSIEARNIPALLQPTNSVDCGLYPFHLLRVFLRDRDKAIQYCSKVCDRTSQYTRLVNWHDVGLNTSSTKFR
jgi:hypothetical protein